MVMVAVVVAVVMMVSTVMVAILKVAAKLVDVDVCKRRPVAPSWRVL
jgi:hypothetical protein